MPLCSIKWRPLNFFAKLHKNPLLISNVVKDAVSDLRQFLAIESPWEIIKNFFLIRTCCEFSLNQSSGIREVWKYWPLKDGFGSISQKFYRTAILWWVEQKTFLESGFQNIVLSSLLLFLCACYQVDLGDIQWKEVATSTVRNFNNYPYTSISQIW